MLLYIGVILAPYPERRIRGKYTNEFKNMKKEEVLGKRVMKSVGDEILVWYCWGNHI
jgi:hypothetical protein